MVRRLGVIGVATLLGLSSAGVASASGGAPLSHAQAADRAAAAAANLRLSDLPAGWKQSASLKTTFSPSTENTTTASFARCIHVTLPAHPSRPVGAQSPLFKGPTGLTEAQSQVLYYATAAQAEQTFALEANPKTPGCLEQFYAAALRKSKPTAGLSVRFTVDRLPSPAIGDEHLTLGIDFKISVSTTGSTGATGATSSTGPTSSTGATGATTAPAHLALSVYGDLDTIRVGRALVVIISEGTKPPSRALGLHLAKISVGHLTNTADSTPAA